MARFCQKEGISAASFYQWKKKLAGQANASKARLIADKLQGKILNRRENLGTIFEISWALLLQKPLILIVPERRREIFEKHPFTCRASVIVTSVKELTDGKYLQILYKSIASAIY